MTTKSTITPELLDHLLANYEKPEDLTGDGGLFKQLKKALIERALGAELTEHLGYEKGDPAGRGPGRSPRVTKRATRPAAPAPTAARGRARRPSGPRTARSRFRSHVIAPAASS